MNACTLWFDRIGPLDWHACCVWHDWAYRVGIPKAMADATLAHCVNGVLPGMGDVMWFGVALLGGLWYAAARRRAQ